MPHIFFGFYFIFKLSKDIFQEANNSKKASNDKISLKTTLQSKNPKINKQIIKKYQQSSIHQSLFPSNNNLILINKLKSVQSFVRFPLPDQCRYPLPIINIVIYTCIISVLVYHFFQVVYTRVGQLDQRGKDGTIVCVIVKCPVLVT